MTSQTHAPSADWARNVRSQWLAMELGLGPSLKLGLAPSLKLGLAPVLAIGNGCAPASGAHV
jgi:hypothetical protein